MAILCVGMPNDIIVNAIEPRERPQEANSSSITTNTKIDAIVYAYTSRESETDNTPFITASQKLVRDGIIACPRKYPFGTKFLIKGKEYICEDRMNIRHENGKYEVFDIWMSDLNSTKQWGKQYLKIEVLTFY